MAPVYTPRQGQFLAFIYYHTKLHGVPPAEADMRRYLRVTPRPYTRWSSRWSARASSPESLSGPVIGGGGSGMVGGR
jgi:hypothetical protein